MKKVVPVDEDIADRHGDGQQITNPHGKERVVTVGLTDATSSQQVSACIYFHLSELGGSCR